MAARRIRIANEVLSSLVGDEAVLLSVETGHYFGLNRVGARAWSLLCEGYDLDAVSARLLEEFDVGEAVLRDDLNRLVEDLVRAGLLVVEDDPSSGDG